MANTTQQSADDEAFAAEFNAEDKQPAQQSDDEAFGIGAGSDAGAGGDGQGTGDKATADGEDEAQTTGADAQVDATAAAAPSDAEDKEKRLQEREEQLRAKEIELDQRAATLATSNTNETQTSIEKPDDLGGEAGDTNGSGSARAALTEDFGPEFVNQLEAFIKEVATGTVSGEIGTLASTVQNVIDSLTNERNQQHFQKIAEAHEDFMEIVESPSFTEWLEGHEGTEKADLQRIVDSGSAKEIIAMLTKFKTSTQASEPGVNDDELDAAEGVRGSGLRLPEDPQGAHDYATAWNQA